MCFLTLITVKRQKTDYVAEKSNLSARIAYLVVSKTSKSFLFVYQLIKDLVLRRMITFAIA
jgi:hypothetical protein